MAAKRQMGVWKTLFIAVFACTLVFFVCVGLGVYWVFSIREHHRGQVQTLPDMVEETFGVPGTDTQSASATSSGPPRNTILPPRTNGVALPGDDLFQDAVIPTLVITIPSREVSALNRNNRTYVRATIQEGAVTYSNVANRLKGGPGSFREFNNHPAFTVNFDTFAPGQTFHGLKKIHLNNSVQDSTLLAEKISRELFEAAGVPVPRAGNAKVTVNGRDLGMYVLVEGVNKQFLKRYFKNAKGNVYDGHSGTDVTDRLPVNSGDNPSDYTALEALARATREPDLDVRLAALEKTLDMDRFLSFVAMEVILEHWDGYTIGRNNYRIFHDQTANRMVFIPQGLDQVLNRQQQRLFPHAAGLVARSVLEIPEARRRYRKKLEELKTNVFVTERITNRIFAVGEKIEAALAKSSRRAAQSYHLQPVFFAERFRKRARTLATQLAPATPAAGSQFNRSDMGTLSNWETKLDGGPARLDRVRDADGNILLHIATDEFCTASWRTTAHLDRGSYRFVGRIKTKGVVFRPDDSRACAGLRKSLWRIGQKNSGDRDWTPVVFDFEVDEDDSSIVLVCELRAERGEIWFDQQSLQLKRR